MCVPQKLRYIQRSTVLKNKLNSYMYLLYIFIYLLASRPTMFISAICRPSVEIMTSTYLKLRGVSWFLIIDCGDGKRPMIAVHNPSFSLLFRWSRFFVNFSLVRKYFHAQCHLLD